MNSRSNSKSQSHLIKPNDTSYPNGCVVCCCCGYTKVHPEVDKDDEAARNHYTCLCILLESSVICCLNGYDNLVSNIPSLALFAPVPQSCSDDYLKGSGSTEGVIKMTIERSQMISGGTTATIMKALAGHLYLKTNVLPIRYVEKL
jgi:hypothetical protein